MGNHSSSEMSSDDCPVIATSAGKVKGRLFPKLKQAGARNVFHYNNIPFAKPPVGPLRFEPPQKPDSWKGILDGTKNPPSPFQVTDGIYFIDYETVAFSNQLDYKVDHMSEDCLFLSVYTPKPNKDANLPVIFWIYGGAFQFGTQSTYHGGVFSSLHDVVLVIPNYRVGALGFFTTGKDTDWSGNMGLLDQVMALKWTKENIRNFGGNPDNVTIFGESAGGISVNLHMMSPLSKGLFHRAISASGTSLMPGYANDSLESVTENFLEKLKITDKDPKEIVAKLKQLPAKEIGQAQGKMFEEMLLFTPVVDGKFLLKPVSELLDEDWPSPVPYAVGCNNSEMSGTNSRKDPEGFGEGISEETCREYLKGYIGAFVLKNFPDEALDLIMKEYTPKFPDDQYKWSKVYAEIFADVLFVFPVNKIANAFSSKGGKTFVFYMTQQLKYNHDPEFGSEKQRKPFFCDCDHMDDIIFSFGVPLDDKLMIEVKFSEEEKQLSRQWMTYLANFAANGDPNNGDKVPMEWPEYRENEQSYLVTKTPFECKDRLAHDRYKFWTQVIEPLCDKKAGEK